MTQHKKKRIISIKRSPLNPLQWCCDLACGHQVWVTAKRKTRAKVIGCPRCLELDRQALKSALQDLGML